MSELIEESPKVTDAPKVIWLTYGDISEDVTHQFAMSNSVVLWCEDKVECSDVKYIAPIPSSPVWKRLRGCGMPPKNGLTKARD